MKRMALLVISCIFASPALSTQQDSDVNKTKDFEVILHNIDLNNDGMIDDKEMSKLEQNFSYESINNKNTDKNKQEK